MARWWTKRAKEIYYIGLCRPSTPVQLNVTAMASRSPCSRVDEAMPYNRCFPPEDDQNELVRNWSR